MLLTGIHVADAVVDTVVYIVIEDVQPHLVFASRLHVIVDGEGEDGESGSAQDGAGNAGAQADESAGDGAGQRTVAPVRLRPMSLDHALGAGEHGADHRKVFTVRSHPRLHFCGRGRGASVCFLVRMHACVCVRACV